MTLILIFIVSSSITMITWAVCMNCTIAPWFVTFIAICIRTIHPESCCIFMLDKFSATRAIGALFPNFCRLACCTWIGGWTVRGVYIVIVIVIVIVRIVLHVYFSYISTATTISTRHYTISPAAEMNCTQEVGRKKR